MLCTYHAKRSFIYDNEKDDDQNHFVDQSSLHSILALHLLTEARLRLGEKLITVYVAHAQADVDIFFQHMQCAKSPTLFEVVDSCYQEGCS